MLPSAIYIVSAGGGEAHAITGYIVGTEGWKLSWSPDGSKIAFESDSLTHSGRGICTINSDGSGFQRLTGDSTYNSDPSWSHDGSKFTFSRYEIREYYNYYQIYVMNADGSNQHRITNNPGHDWGASWGPYHR